MTWSGNYIKIKRLGKGNYPEDEDIMPLWNDANHLADEMVS